MDQRVKHTEENIEKVRRKTNMILYTLKCYLKNITFVVLFALNKEY
jgi:hypothetical protein